MSSSRSTKGKERKPCADEQQRNAPGGPKVSTESWVDVSAPTTSHRVIKEVPVTSEERKPSGPVKNSRKRTNAEVKRRPQREESKGPRSRDESKACHADYEDYGKDHEPECQACPGCLGLCPCPGCSGFEPPAYFMRREGSSVKRSGSSSSSSSSSNRGAARPSFRPQGAPRFLFQDQLTDAGMTEARLQDHEQRLDELEAREVEETLVSCWRTLQDKEAELKEKTGWVVALKVQLAQAETENRRLQGVLEAKTAEDEVGARARPIEVPGSPESPRSPTYSPVSPQSPTYSDDDGVIRPASYWPDPSPRPAEITVVIGTGVVKDEDAGADADVAEVEVASVAEVEVASVAEVEVEVVTEIEVEVVVEVEVASEEAMDVDLKCYE
jgi:hypothetical protein